MKEPKWKIWLSYLAEIHIESASSAFNPHLYISLRKGRYQLSTARAIYSYGDLYSNFDQTFQRLDLDRLPGDEVLLLGLGIGSIPYILEKKLGRSYYYTAVEIDEVVMDLASRYVLPDLTSPIELVCADAYAYALQTPRQFDLICMDVFLDDQIPAPFESEVFLEALRDSIRSGGVLLFNRLAAKPADIASAEAFFQKRFLPVFPEAASLDVENNRMLVSRRQLLRTDFTQS